MFQMSSNPKATDSFFVLILTKNSMNVLLTLNVFHDIPWSISEHLKAFGHFHYRLWLSDGLQWDGFLKIPHKSSLFCYLRSVIRKTSYHHNCELSVVVVFFKQLYFFLWVFFGYIYDIYKQANIKLTIIKWTKWQSEHPERASQNLSWTKEAFENQARERLHNLDVICKKWQVKFQACQQLCMAGVSNLITMKMGHICLHV